MGALAIAFACGGLGGCVSTQHKNERAKLVATRELDSRRAQRVTRTSQDVRVVAVTLVEAPARDGLRGGRGETGRGRSGDGRRARRGGGPRASAVVVELRNGTATALADVPVEVGVRTRDGRRTPLNAGRGLDWFQTHVPAIAARGATTWVFLTRRPVPAGARPYARVGAGATELPAGAGLPRLEARADGSAAPAGGGRDGAVRVRVAVDNASEVPQYGAQVYALVRRDGRWTAAGKATVRHLGTHGRATTAVALAGSPGDGPVRVQAIPTIFE